MTRELARDSRARHRYAGVVAVLAGLTVLVGLVPAAPASAHSGGKAVVLVTNLAVAPDLTGTGWQATVLLADYDSGAPLTRSDVTMLVNSATEPVTMAETTVPGQYSAALSGVAPGALHIELAVRSLPGQEPIQPYDGTWDTTVAAGQPTVLVDGAGEVGSGGPPMGLIVGLVALVLVVALLYGLFVARRRTAAPARAS